MRIRIAREINQLMRRTALVVVVYLNQSAICDGCNRPFGIESFFLRYRANIGICPQPNEHNTVLVCFGCKAHYKELLREDK